MTKFRAKIGENVLTNSYYPEHIKKCIGKEIFLRNSICDSYFGCLPKDNTKEEYCFYEEDLVDIEEIIDEVYDD